MWIQVAEPIVEEETVIIAQYGEMGATYIQTVGWLQVVPQRMNTGVWSWNKSFPQGKGAKKNKRLTNPQMLPEHMCP